MPRLRLVTLFCITPFLGSCVSAPVSKPRVLPPVKKLIVVQPKLQLPPTLTTEVTVKRAEPQSYRDWLKQGEHQQEVDRYYNFLQQHRAGRAAPMFELLRSARDWERCGSEPYVVPPQELWDNLLPTLQVLQQLRDEKILDNIEVTSVYRDPTLNQCANGAARSKHVQNAALDFRIGSEEPDSSELEKIAEAKYRLCQFWAERGEQFNLGLGVYASGQIHLDTQGYRTWGPDLTHNSSICPA
jgi:uncharacterized protein YcbK (DUF882 family)